MQPEDLVNAAFCTIDDADPTLLDYLNWFGFDIDFAATLRSGVVGTWSEKSGVTALLRSLLQRIMIERPTSVVEYMIEYFEKLQPKKIVIFGPPACGKRKLGEFLSRRLGLEYVSLKDLVDGVSSTDTNFGAVLRDCMSRHISPPNDFLGQMIMERLREKDCQDKGWILDGWPTATEHVSTLYDSNLAPTICIVLELPDVVVEDRVAFRVYDPSTRQLYHMTTNPPPLGVGGRCITRHGESTAEILERLSAYHNQIPPILDTLRELCGVMEIRLNVDVSWDHLEVIGEDVARKIDKEAA